MKKMLVLTLFVLLIFTIVSLVNSSYTYAGSDDLAIIYPSSGEKILAGSTQQILWEGYEEYNFDIYLSLDSGNTYDIFLGSSSQGSFIWEVPDVSTEVARVKIISESIYLPYHRAPVVVEAENEGDFSIGKVPEAPFDLYAIDITSNSVTVAWSMKSDNINGFSLEKNNNEILILGADEQMAVIGSIDPSTTYSFRIRAINDFGYSEYSNQISVFTKAQIEDDLVPMAPSDLSASAISSSEIRLDWKNNSDDENGFRISRTNLSSGRIDLFDIKQQGIDGFLDKDLMENTEYSYRLRAYNDIGYSDYSNTATAVTFEKAQIDFPKIPEVKMSFEIDNEYYLTDDTTGFMDVTPILLEGEPLIPIRYLAEFLGANINWDTETKEALITIENRVINIMVGSSYATVNGRHMYIDPQNHDTTPVIVPPGRIMLPLGFISAATGSRLDWNPKGNILDLVYYPKRTPDILEQLVVCDDNVIDFEDIEAGKRVYNQYGNMGVTFPSIPKIFQLSGSRSLISSHQEYEHGRDLLIEFTTPQTCVSMMALLGDTYGNEVLASLRAYSADEIVIIPGYGMEIHQGDLVAAQYKLIGPGPVSGVPMKVHTSDDPLISRVELSYELFLPAIPQIDDLAFSIIGEPFPIVSSVPKITIDTPSDKENISGYSFYPSGVVLSGTIQEEFMLEEVTLSIRQGDNENETTVYFSGQKPDYEFYASIDQSLLFSGSNELTISARSFSGYTSRKTIEINYMPLNHDQEAELLILAYDDFYGALEPLREWKNQTGISTHIMTLGSIEKERRFGLPQARDLPEKIKKIIARAYQINDTRYVMLVGDGDRFPVRYHKTGREGVSWGVVYRITDLYYGCLFKPDGSFDDWDGNENNIIGEWWNSTVDGGLADNFDMINIDDCSLKPDVAIGRVPASTIEEVEIYVSKVIEYEAEEITYQTKWHDFIVLWSGTPKYPGDEAYLESIAANLPDSEYVHIGPWAAKKYRPDNFDSWEDTQKNQYVQGWTDTLLERINKGVVFAVYIGHGSRQSMGVLNAENINLLDNKGMYPVFIAAACDTAKFVFEFDIYKDIDGNYPPCWPDCHLLDEDERVWPDPNPEPAAIQPSMLNIESMAEVLLFAQDKGGIGFIGAHSGTNVAGPPYAELFMSFWRQDNVERLGDMWTNTVISFIETYLESDHDFGRSPFMSHHIHMFGLFGDPSLRIKPQ